MEYFDKINGQFQFLGFGKRENPTDRIKSNIRQIICVAILSNLALSVFWFCAFDATAFGECGNSLLMLFNAITCIISHQRVCRLSHRFNEVFDNIYTSIQKREY